MQYTQSFNTNQYTNSKPSPPQPLNYNHTPSPKVEKQPKTNHNRERLKQVAIPYKKPHNTNAANTVLLELSQYYVEWCNASQRPSPLGK